MDGDVSPGKGKNWEDLGGGAALGWQRGFFLQSFLANGNVAAYSTLDAQVNYTFSKIDCIIKLGGSNVLNKYYYSFLGGPSIGAMYYLTLTYGFPFLPRPPRT